MNYEEEMAYAYKEEHGEFPKYPVSDNKPVVYPEDRVGFKINKSETFTDKNGNEYKRVFLETQSGKNLSVLAFSSFPYYNKIEKDNYVLGYVLDKQGKQTLVDRPNLSRQVLLQNNWKYINYKD